MDARAADRAEAPATLGQVLNTRSAGRIEVSLYGSPIDHRRIVAFAAARPRPCLLDENLDHRLAAPLAALLGWRATSVRAESWRGLKNGPLIEAMAEAGLSVLVTGDRTLYAQRQQRLRALGIGVVLVRDPNSAAARLEGIADAVRTVSAGALVEA